MTLNCLEKTKDIGDKQRMQDYIDKLVRWQMLFNFGKCKYLHTGPGNNGMSYGMGGTILSKTVNENTHLLIYVTTQFTVYLSNIKVIITKFPS